MAEYLPDTQVRDRLQSMSLLDPHQPLSVIAEQYGASGYVVESVPLAIFAAQSSSEKDFEGVLREVIALGGDTDTNASMTGQLVGAWLGGQQLPAHLRAKIPQHEVITSLAQQLAA